MAWQSYDVLGRPRRNRPRVDYSENKRKAPPKPSPSTVPRPGETDRVRPADTTGPPLTRQQEILYLYNLSLSCSGVFIILALKTKDAASSS
jgi:hypothetical protein